MTPTPAPTSDATVTRDQTGMLQCYSVYSYFPLFLMLSKVKLKLVNILLELYTFII